MRYIADLKMRHGEKEKGTNICCYLFPMFYICSNFLPTFSHFRHLQHTVFWKSHFPSTFSSVYGFSSRIGHLNSISINDTRPAYQYAQENSFLPLPIYHCWPSDTGPPQTSLAMDTDWFSVYLLHMASSSVDGVCVDCLHLCIKDIIKMMQLSYQWQ